MKDIGDRIKCNYENRSRYYLTRRTPVIIRIDGKAFHSYTHDFDKPFDINMMDSMVQIAVHMSQEIQGFKAAYVQSDEISILLTDYDQLSTEAWFDYNKSKIESISASMATAYFNHYMTIHGKTEKLALFDARSFNIPREEVCNYFLWRMLDWERNSVMMYCNSFFSHSQMQNKGQADQHEMLHSIGKNWTKDLSADMRNGTFVLRDRKRSNVVPLYSYISDVIDPLIYPLHICRKE